MELNPLLQVGFPKLIQLNNENQPEVMDLTP